MASASTGPAAQPPTPAQVPTIPSANPASPPTKRDLKSWWKNFRLPKNQEQNETKSQGIFGVPLRQSITYANVAISMYDDDGQSYIYGYVPIVVAKCGVYLKEKATGVEGIFRLSGSEKRIKELKHMFDSPDRYGKGLDWEGYTVHDAANVLRRYLNDLPEPVVPLDLYEQFRDPLRDATTLATGDADGPQFVEDFDQRAAIERYQTLITELPPLNRQLLLYILDLLAVFAAKSEENRMTSQNLAAIFQPGMLSHPNHAMSPEEYRLNQCVLIFLIENQDHFILGMQGTAADEETKQEVESGTPAATPVTPTASKRRSGGGVYRSSSNASAGAQSVLRDGQIRRNRSVTSRHSKRDDDTGTSSPTTATTPSGGLGRSNTVPSKKSPAVAGGKFKKGRDAASGTHSPSRLETLPQAQSVGTPNQSENSSLAPPVGGTAAASSGAGRSQERLLGVPHEHLGTPQKDRTLQNLFQRSPTDESRRQPNKLKKKRIPGSEHPSAQSSSTSLAQPGAVSPAVETANPMENPGRLQEQVGEEGEAGEVKRVGEQSAAVLQQQNGDMTSDSTPRASQIQPSGTLQPEGTLRSQRSPPTSLNSSFNGGSDLDQAIEPHNGSSTDPDKERKSRWRISRARKDDWGRRAPSSDNHMRSNDPINTSEASFGSGSVQKSRRSFTTDPSSDPAPAITEDSQHDSGREDPKGPIGWIRNKYREAKENAEHRRAKSPSADNGLGGVGRGKSMDVKRDVPTEEKDSQPAEAKPAASVAQQEPPQPEKAEATEPLEKTEPAEKTETPAAIPETTERPEPEKTEQSEQPPEQPSEQPVQQEKEATQPPAPATVETVTEDAQQMEVSKEK